MPGTPVVPRRPLMEGSSPFWCQGDQSWSTPRPVSWTLCAPQVLGGGEDPRGRSEQGQGALQRGVHLRHGRPCGHNHLLPGNRGVPQRGGEVRGPSQACVTPQPGLCPPKPGVCPWLMDMEPPPRSIFPLQDRKQLRVVLRLERGSLFPPGATTRSLPAPATSFLVPSCSLFLPSGQNRDQGKPLSPPKPLQVGCGVVPVPSCAVLAALCLFHPVDYFSPF